MLLLCLVAFMSLVTGSLYVASKKTTDKGIRILLEVGTLIFIFPTLAIVCAAFVGLGG